MKNLLIISNDKIYFSNSIVSSKYNDIINILETTQKKFNIFLLSRRCDYKDNFSLKKRKIFRFDFKKFFFLRKKKFKVLIVSITPRNIFFYFLLNLFVKNLKGFVYLRSDGYKEYQTRLGRLGLIIFSLLMRSIKKSFKIISVNKNIKASKIDHIIYPSELDESWFKKKKLIKTDIPKLLYLGRFRKDKGVFSLIELFLNTKYQFQLTIAGDKNYPNLSSKNLKFLNELSNKKEIINLYDNHDIFILPSYTEGSPKVILESLARRKPVIIFKDIAHVKNKFKGIFICERNSANLENKIKYIIQNYQKIQKEMNKNKLITKKHFQKKFINILND